MSDGLIEDEFTNRPDDDELAFLYFEKLHITKFKLTIEAVDIPLPRKEALMAKLNAFAAEVDRDRTKFEAFGALMIEAAGMVGKVERKLRPIRKWLDSIANVMHEANALESGRLRLPAPPKCIECLPSMAVAISRPCPTCLAACRTARRERRPRATSTTHSRHGLRRRRRLVVPSLSFRGT